MKIAILEHPAHTSEVVDHCSGVTVWALLDDDGLNSDPRDRGESFVIGEGVTRAEAIKHAQLDLEHALEQLAAMEAGAEPPAPVRRESMLAALRVAEEFTRIAPHDRLAEWAEMREQITGAIAHALGEPEVTHGR